MTETTPADELRAAARRIRETAAPLIPPNGDPGEWVRFYLTADHALTREDEAWIALAHPGLAEPLAALLEGIADTADRHEAQGWGNTADEMIPGPLAEIARAVNAAGQAAERTP